MPNYWYGNVTYPEDSAQNKVIDVKGTEEVIAVINQLVAEFPEEVQKAIFKDGELILQKSLDQCPWDETHLKQTGTVEIVKDGGVWLKVWRPDMGDSIGVEFVSIPGAQDGEVVIGYNTPYALKQHEDLTLNHPKPGAKAKYLEDPANEITPYIAQDVADQLGSKLS